MTNPFKIIKVIERQFASDSRAYVYTGRKEFGALLIKWQNHQRVLVNAWHTSSPIGRKKLLAAIQRYRSFKGHKIDAWIFIASKLRQNTYRLLDEFSISLIEIEGPESSLTLLGGKNLPEGMFSVILRGFEKNHVTASYEFDGLVSNSPNDSSDPKVRPVATRTKRVTAFISYSWDSDEHRRWVLKLAADLIRNGVNILIDEWDLEDFGNDLNLFMESGVRESDFVLMVCTSSYAKRANARTGGVGVESTIITGELYSSDNPNKFIPLFRGNKSNLEECLPTYLKGKLAVQFSDSSSYDSSLENLLRRLAGRPRFKKPELGTFPELPETEI